MPKGKREIEVPQLQRIEHTAYRSVTPVITDPEERQWDARSSTFSRDGV